MNSCSIDQVKAFIQWILSETIPVLVVLSMHTLLKGKSIQRILTVQPWPNTTLGMTTTFSNVINCTYGIWLKLQ